LRVVSNFSSINLSKRMLFPFLLLLINYTLNILACKYIIIVIP